MFSKMDSQVSDLDDSSFDGRRKTEQLKTLVQRLMYFFGPYAKNDQGESLF